MIQQKYPRLVAIGFTLTLLVALLGFLARAASAQRVAADSTIRLTLHDAVRLAARQNASVESARHRVEAAEARVTQRRADLLPTFSATVAEHGSTLNSAALFPIDFPSAPGQPPLFARDGSLLGPLNGGQLFAAGLVLAVPSLVWEPVADVRLNVFDARARVSQSLLDPGAIGRLRGARTGVQAAGADVANVADVPLTKYSVASSLAYQSGLGPERAEGAL